MYLKYKQSLSISISQKISTKNRLILGKAHFWSIFIVQTIHTGNSHLKQLFLWGTFRMRNKFKTNFLQQILLRGAWINWNVLLKLHLCVQFHNNSSTLSKIPVFRFFTKIPENPTSDSELTSKVTYTLKFLSRSDHFSILAPNLAGPYSYCSVKVRLKYCHLNWKTGIRNFFSKVSRIGTGVFWNIDFF